MSDGPIVSLENIYFSYNKEPVLENVNLKVAEKEFVWIVGPNGGGKTTLMKILLGLLHPQRGKVRVFGKPIAESRHRIGYVPQQTGHDPKFPITAFDIVLMGCIRSGVKTRRYSGDDRDSATRALQTVGLIDYAGRPMSELSGGQQRRLLIARALSCNPELLILDEPTANLDQQIERELYDLLLKLNESLTIILVSHDPDFVMDFVKQVVCVNRTLAVHPTSDMDRRYVDRLYGAKFRMVQHNKGEHTEPLDDMAEH